MRDRSAHGKGKMVGIGETGRVKGGGGVWVDTKTSSRAAKQDWARVKIHVRGPDLHVRLNVQERDGGVVGIRGATWTCGGR